MIPCWQSGLSTKEPKVHAHACAQVQKSATYFFTPSPEAPARNCTSFQYLQKQLNISCGDTWTSPSRACRLPSYAVSSHSSDKETLAPDLPPTGLHNDININFNDLEVIEWQTQSREQFHSERSPFLFWNVRSCWNNQYIQTIQINDISTFTPPSFIVNKQTALDLLKSQY